MPIQVAAMPIGAREPLGEFEALVTAVHETLDRDDFTKVQISNFIALAEAQFNRVLRVPQMEKLATISLIAGTNDYALPDDFLRLRSLNQRGCHSFGETAPQRPISCAHYSITGNPRRIRFHRDVGEDQTLDLLYYATIAAINESNPDNWLLNDYPDVYYYGTLVQAEAFQANDERVPLWKAALEQALSELQDAGNRDRYGSGPLVPRGSMVQVRGARI